MFDNYVFKKISLYYNPFDYVFLPYFFPSKISGATQPKNKKINKNENKI